MDRIDSLGRLGRRRGEGLRARLEFMLLSYAGAAGVAAVALTVVLVSTPVGKEAGRAAQQVAGMSAEGVGRVVSWRPPPVAVALPVVSDPDSARMGPAGDSRLETS